MSLPIRVAVIDDHAILREGLAVFLRSQEDMILVGQAADQRTALELLKREHPDVAVIDLALGSEDGLELVGAVRSVSPGTKTLVLTMHEEQAYVRAATLAGAQGYAIKRGSSRAVLEAIRQVAAGHRYRDPALGPPSEPPGEQAVHRLDVLTPRERQVFERVARGETHREIAEQLGIGKKSVDTYRVRLYQKLGIASRAELVRIALEARVLTKSSLFDGK